MQFTRFQYFVLFYLKPILVSSTSAANEKGQTSKMLKNIFGYISRYLINLKCYFLVYSDQSVERTLKDHEKSRT